MPTEESMEKREKRAEHKFTFEQIRHQAQENALAYLLASVVYHKERSQSPQQFMTAVGHILAPGWKDLKGHGAQVVMDTLALHIVSLGGTLVSTTGDDAIAFATFAHLPSSEVLKFFGLTKHEADAIWDIFKPIATSLKLEYEWAREQDQITLKLSRSGAPNA